MNENRRGFLMRTVALLGLLSLPLRSFGQGDKPAKKVNAKTNKFAQGIGYKDKVDPKKDKDLVVPETKEAKNCWTCALYEAQPDAAHPEKSKQGVCKLMMAQEERIVNALGGCRSWGQNAATKGMKYQG